MSRNDAPTLYLIDGYAQFFRAYHAIRNPMTSPVTKEPTNMTFGFVGMLLKLLRGEGRINGPPQYVACTLDVSGDHGTFRSRLYPDYKATRPDPPEDLHPQVERCIALMTELGIPILGAEGFEADDVIATLVRTLREQHPDLRIRVISKDKDLKQLLDTDHVELYDIHHDTVIDTHSLEEESGIRPDQVIDMLALMGDTVDNVPGVEGVGPKTAAQLIAKYGTLDELLANADEIKGKRGERIRAATDALALSKQLVTLRDDADVSLDLDDAKVGNLELSRLSPILRELGFNRYQEELKQLLGGDAEAPAEAGRPNDDGGLFSDSLFASEHEEVRVSGDYWCVKTKDELDDLVQKLTDAPAFAVDTETTALDPFDAKLAGLSFSVEPGSGWYVPVRSPDASS
ncbi:MAG: 5'-3' exonuclease H3TH domain-containing protein, partial [Planctomycetota bacterium]